MTSLVSVCIPAYNSAAYIERTVRSILDQTYEDLEVIVVDDASSDGTADVVEAIVDPRLRVVRNERNLGAVGNWNRSLDLTSGALVKLVCGDDVLYPTCIQLQAEALGREADASMAAAKRDIIDRGDRVLLRSRGLGGLEGYVRGPQAIRAAVRSGTNPFGEPFSVLMRRSAIEEIGGFRDRAYVIDLDYWTRLLEVGGLVAVPESLGAFRVVPTSWSRRIGRDQSRQTTTLFRALQERLPEVVSPMDLRRGSIAARLHNTARLLLYRALRF